MDWHKLQQTLFELDPTDPREDLAKLRAQAQGGASDVPPTKDYINESVEVAPGSMPLGIDNIADFAALAGVRLDEKQKHGDYARGSDPMPKAEPGRTKHPLKDKLVGEDEFDEARFDKFKQGWQAVKPGGKYGPDALERGISKAFQPSGAEPVERPKRDEPKKTVKSDPLRLQPIVKKYQSKLTVISQDPKLAKQFDDFMKSIPESTVEAKKLETPKQRNPVAAHAQRSGAGVHKDQNKKNQLPRKEKHKGKVPMESIKEVLYRKLAEKK